MTTLISSETAISFDFRLFVSSERFRDEKDIFNEKFINWDNSLPKLSLNSSQKKSILKGIQDIDQGKSKIMTAEDFMSNLK